MNFELTRLMTFASEEDLAKSIALSETSVPVSAFMSKFIEFLKANRLDDIENIVAKGELEACFPKFGSAEAVSVKKWDDIEGSHSGEMNQTEFDRYLSGS